MFYVLLYLSSGSGEPTHFFFDDKTEADVFASTVNANDDASHFLGGGRPVFVQDVVPTNLATALDEAGIEAE